ncbi:MAG: class I SAM-dependent methyltransferase [Verrucomicrobiota bacterium]|nr:class I SAM-dependent methyltransferase [Verrucomicrobiota bacterium]
MSVFEDYATIYQAFYRDKDYASEAAYVLDTLRQCGLAGHSLLELGCGQGGHALPFARLGCTITGVDRSAGMIARANEVSKSLSAEAAGAMLCMEGDARTVRLCCTFDAVVSLFHVISYMPGNEDVLAMLATARAHLQPGGLFAFDYWSGPAVLQDPPVIRIRSVEHEGATVTRLASPTLRPAENRVDVHYTFTVEQGILRHSFEEVHAMRYFFVPEWPHFARQSGFEVIANCEWLSPMSELPRSWNAYCILRAV